MKFCKLLGVLIDLLKRNDLVLDLRCWHRCFLTLPCHLVHNAVPSFRINSHSSCLYHRCQSSCLYILFTAAHPSEKYTFKSQLLVHEYWTHTRPFLHSSNCRGVRGHRQKTRKNSVKLGKNAKNRLKIKEKA